MSKIMPSVDMQQDGAADRQSWRYDAASGGYALYTPVEALGDLSDVDTAGGVDGDALVLIGGVWTPGIAGGGSAPIIEDEGVALGTAGTLNFTGAGVTASLAGGVATVNIPGGAGSSPITAKVLREASPQSIPSGNNTAIDWDTVEWDSNAMIDLTTHPTRATITSANKYRVTCGVAFAANATGLRFALLQRNGTGVTLVQDSRPALTGVATILGFCVELNLAANDYLELYVNQNSGAALNCGGDARTFMSVTSI